MATNFTGVDRVPMGEQPQYFPPYLQKGTMEIHEALQAEGGKDELWSGNVCCVQYELQLKTSKNCWKVAENGGWERAVLHQREQPEDTFSKGKIASTERCGQSTGKRAGVITGTNRSEAGAPGLPWPVRPLSTSPRPPRPPPTSEVSARRQSRRKPSRSSC